MRGLPDIAGCVPLGLIMLILMRTRYLSSASKTESCLFGFLLWLPFALRRWYSFSIIAIVTTAIIFAIYLLTETGITRQKFWHATQNYIIAGITLLTFLFGFQSKLVLQILHSSYSTAYTHYQAPFSVQIGTDFYPNIGPVYAILFLVGIALSIKNKNINVFFCSIVPVLTFLLFSRIQSASYHHLPPEFFWMFIVSAYGVLTLLKARSNVQALSIGYAAVLYGWLGCAFVFWPPARAALSPIAFLLPSQSLPPLRVANPEAYRDMIATLRMALRDKEKFSVFAFGKTFNQGMMFTLAPDLIDSMVNVSVIDQRDDMDTRALEADVAIVLTPIDQLSDYVISIPATAILDGKGIGRNYVRVSPAFHLAPECEAYIYRRTAPMSEADIDWLQSELNRYYPTWRKVTMPPDSHIMIMPPR